MKPSGTPFGCQENLEKYETKCEFWNRIPTRPVKLFPARLRFLSALSLVRTWNFNSSASARTSRMIAVTLPEFAPSSPSQKTPCQAEGQSLVFNDATVAESQDETAPLGSLWIPFLNSSKDRSSESEAEWSSGGRERVRRRRRRRRRSRSVSENGGLGLTKLECVWLPRNWGKQK